MYGYGDYTFSGSILVILDYPGQTEISYFTEQAVRNQHIGSPQVPMDVVLLLNVSHAFSNLRPQEQKQRHIVTFPS